MNAREESGFEDLRARYARQMILPGIGEEGQSRLHEARVLLVGLGGLGSPVALYLAAAGVGTLGLIDDDRVDVSNLQRQVLFRDVDRGREKVEAAAEALRALSPSITLETHGGRFTGQNARELVASYDVVVDGTDNFPARYAVNDACVLERRPNVHAAVQQFEGQITVFGSPGGPCYRCLFPEAPPVGMVPSCADAGILGVLPGTLGMLQATEVLKLLLGIGEPLVGRLLRWDALAGRFREVRIARDPSCPVCGDSPVLHDVIDVGESCAHRAESADEGVRDMESPEFDISVEELARRRDAGDAPVILDVRLPEELTVASIDGDVLHIPLHLLPQRLDELDADREYAVLCHMGARSWQAVHFLRSEGFPRARNVVGGIELWSLAIDPAVPRY